MHPSVTPVRLHTDDFSSAPLLSAHRALRLAALLCLPASCVCRLPPAALLCGTLAGRSTKRYSYQTRNKAAAGCLSCCHRHGWRAWTRRLSWGAGAGGCWASRRRSRWWPGPGSPSQVSRWRRRDCSFGVKIENYWRCIFFSPPHNCFRSWQTTHLGNKI